MYENFRDLVEELRRDARTLQQYGDGSYKALERAADRLVEVIEGDDQTLKLTEAAKISGYTPDHLGRLVRSGDIPNAGRLNAPSIRRKDLPIKPGHLTDDCFTFSVSGKDKGQVLRDVVHNGGP